MIIHLNAFSQNILKDSSLLAHSHFEKPDFAKRKIKFLTPKNKNPLVKYNPVSLGFGGLMYFYQGVLSPQISSNCAYKISCSNFSKLCIHRFGLIKGVALSADRLIRCTPFAAIDIDQHDVDHKLSKINDDPEKYIYKK